MSSDIHSVLVGETWRKASLVAKASGSAITSGTVNYYLKCLTGDNAGKWWDGNSWETGEQTNAMTHQADGCWSVTLAATPFVDGILYLEYAKESTDLHVAGEGRLLRGKAVLDAPMPTQGAPLGIDVTGTLNSSVTGHYDPTGMYGVFPCFKTWAESSWSFWYNSGAYAWILSEVVGTFGARYWLSRTDSLEESYDPIGTGTGIATVTITNPQRQQMAREAHGISGTVWHIKYGADDNRPDGLSWATAKVAGITSSGTPRLKTIIEAAAAGDLVLIGAGTFALGNYYASTPASVKIKCAGEYLTTITSTSYVSTHAILGLAANVEVEDLSIVGLRTDVALQYPIGFMTDDAAGTGALLRRVRTNALADGLVVMNTTPCGVRAVECRFESKYDCVRVKENASHLVDLEECELVSHGPFDVQGEEVVRGIALTEGTVRMRGGRIIVDSTSSATPIVAGVQVDDADGVCILDNVPIHVGGSAVATYALQQTAGSLTTIGCEYDRTKTSGTIADIPMHAVDQDGLTIQAAANAALVANNLDHVEATLTAIKGVGWTTETLAAIDTLIDAIKAKTDLVPPSPAAVGSAMTLATTENVYHADVFLTRDMLNSRDEYTVIWYKNGTPVTSGITVPTIQVVRRSNGTDFIVASSMTQIGSTGAFKYDSDVRLVSGEAGIAVVQATIDGASRTWRRVVGRDV